MTIEYKSSFQLRFNRQLEFIASDSPNRARKFRDELKKELNDMKDTPLICRKSIYFDDENIRDYIFKGYTITFRINKENLEVFGFTKYQKEPMDE
ncbi:MAG: type II toxin-antitoxin system RelE/ParE family toxin [Campylobacterales bacterium]|nr:type II toxin-antitoxin system RelE/ParE family toxin [Campylobacterales bacterium]